MPIKQAFAQAYNRQQDIVNKHYSEIWKLRIYQQTKHDVLQKFTSQMSSCDVIKVQIVLHAIQSQKGATVS